MDRIANRNGRPSAQRLRLALILALGLLMTAGCATGTRLRTASAPLSEADGTFSVLLHGCRYGNDIENIALLVKEDSPYRFRIIDLPTSTRTLPGQSAEQAMREASAFIQCTIYDTGNSVFRKIIGPSGATVAFELKPLFSRLEMGAEEVLESSYFLHGDEVRVYLRLDPIVERFQRMDIDVDDDR